MTKIWNNNMTILTNTYPVIFVQSDIFVKWLDVALMQNRNGQKTEIATEENSEQDNSFTKVLNSFMVNSNRIFIDFSQEDKHLYDIARIKLDSPQTIESLGIFYNDNILSMFTQFNILLQARDTVLILYDQAPLDWLIQRLNFYIGIQIRYPHKFNIHVISHHQRPSVLTPVLEQMVTHIHWQLY